MSFSSIVDSSVDSSAPGIYVAKVPDAGRRRHSHAIEQRRRRVGRMAQDTGDADFYGRGGGRGGRDGKGGEGRKEGRGRATQLLRAWRRRRASVCAPPDRWNDFETGSGTVASSRRLVVVFVAFVGAPVGASVKVGTPVAVGAIVGAYVSVVGA